MNHSVISSNLALHNAYHHFQKGQLTHALEIYEKALKNTFSQDFKANIKCTMAVLQQSMGNYDRSVQLLSSTVGSIKHKNNSITMLRVYSSLTLIQILEGKYTKALEYFQKIMQIIEKQSNLDYKRQLLVFTTYLFFRVKNLEEIGQQIQNIDLNEMKMEQIYAICLMAFNSQICKLDSQEKIQKICYEQFMKNKRYDLALFSLRSLIHFTKNLVNKEYYQKELAKLVMMGYFSQSIDFNNFQPFQIIQAIIQQFIIFRNKISQQIQKKELTNSQLLYSKKKQSNDMELMVEWKYAILLIRKELARTKQMDGNSKKQIEEMLVSMQLEVNPLIIRSMTKNSYFLKYYQRIKVILKRFSDFMQIKAKGLWKLGFDSMKKTLLPLSLVSKNALTSSNEEKGKVSIRVERSKSIIKAKEEKQNCIPLGISIVSVASSKNTRQTTRRKIFGEESIQNYHKKIIKMVRLCQYGSFLNKRNFNSQGGQFKFVKITNSFIKWGKDPEKIDTNCQIYPLKDIRSIIYGRVSPNLNEHCNKMLSYSNCFSLLLQKRTLDFYCKDYEQLQAWVCGLTYVLKKEGNKILGYTPGKLRWKKMFAILKQNFIEPLKLSERNKYYYENAYALKLFAKNGYQLPSKAGGKK